MSESLVGKRVGNYVVASLLGSGGMGEVYLAEHPQIGRKVAIKVLASELLTTAQLASRFLAEAKAVARIEHCNVIEVYDFGTLPDGRPYYVMEVLKGRELRSLLESRGKLTAAEALPYLEQICAGLQAAHDCGVVHRDLKFENVFILDRQPLALKLLDFGIAKLLEMEPGSGLTSSGMVMGTPLFIAPEQALGQPERISPRTDLYSLGVMLYWMLAGKPPFNHEATALLLSMHIRDAPPPLRDMEPSISPEIAALVERCLAKDPELRPASAAEVARSFALALASEGSGFRGPTVGAGGAPVGESDLSSMLLAGGRRRTTFSDSAGEVGEAMPDRLPRRLAPGWLALGGGLLVVGLGLGLLLLRGGSSGSAGPQPAPSPAVVASRPSAADARLPGAWPLPAPDAAPALATRPEAGPLRSPVKLLRKRHVSKPLKPSRPPPGTAAEPPPPPQQQPNPKKVGEGTLELPE